MINKVKEKINKLIKEEKISKEELKKALEEISDPWMEVKGILKDKDISPLKYQKRVRKEWTE